MIAVTYRLTLQEPVLATSLSGDPNSAVSYPFIPGSMIRGVVARNYLDTHSVKDLATDARQQFFDGRTRYLNAYPVDDQWRRRLPAPLSWRKEKTRVIDTGLIEDHALMVPVESGFDAPVKVDGFTLLSEGTVSLDSPKRHIAIHTLRERSIGRPTADQGAVYRYEALAPGERFKGAIIVPSKEDGEGLKELLQEGIHQLGGALTAGYGRVQLSQVEVEEDWRECNMPGGDIASGNVLVVTLLSDTILRDERTGATHTDLGAALGLGKPQKAFKSVVPVGGFNRKWGLPLPQTLALRAGSVFVFQAGDDIPATKLDKWMTTGVGERCVEGFGRLAVNWQQWPRMVQEEAPRTNWRARQVELEGEARELAQRMATRRHRRELDQALVRAINRLTIQNAPANNQLSRIRVIARSALSEDNLARISRLFKRRIQMPDNPEAENPYALTDNTLREFDAARVDGQSLSDWIIELADNPDRVWVKLGCEQVTLGEVEPKSVEAVEYAVRLIDGVLSKTLAERR